MSRKIYSSENAEAQSNRIFEKVAQDSKLSDNQKARYIPFVKHLVNQTVFSVEGPINPEEPFGYIVPFIDQVGNDLLSEDETRVHGLLDEIGPEAVINPNVFFNFAFHRAPDLLPPNTTIEKVLSILGEDATKRFYDTTEFPNTKMTVREFIDLYQ